MNIFFFGDSITHGMWDPQGGWVDRIRRKVHQHEILTNFKTYHDVYNLGVDGNTIDQLIKRAESDILPRLESAESMAVVAIGINDSVYFKDGRELISPETFHSELEKLHNILKKHCSKIHFVEITPVDESKTTPFPESSTGKCYSNERISLFNKQLEHFCKENSLALISVNQLFIGNNHLELLSDGLHPNERGHELLFREIYARIGLV